MVYKFTAYLALFLVVCSLALSFVPGAVSVMGFLLSIFALMLSLLTIKSGESIYFKVTLCIFGIGVLLVNDSLRLFYALPQTPAYYKVSVYAFLALIIIALSVYTRRRRAARLK